MCGHKEHLLACGARPNGGWQHLGVSRFLPFNVVIIMFRVSSNLGINLFHTRFLPFNVVISRFRVSSNLGVNLFHTRFLPLNVVISRFRVSSNLGMGVFVCFFLCFFSRLDLPLNVISRFRVSLNISVGFFQTRFDIKIMLLSVGLELVPT